MYCNIIDVALCRWRFCIHTVSKGHIVSVALGPPEDVVDAWGVSFLTDGPVMHPCASVC